MKLKASRKLRHGKNYTPNSMKHQTKQDLIKQQAALHAKYKEYSLKTEEELTEMYPLLGGGYREVCFQVIREKHFDKMEQDLEGEVK